MLTRAELLAKRYNDRQQAKRVRRVKRACTAAQIRAATPVVLTRYEKQLREMDEHFARVISK